MPIKTSHKRAITGNDLSITVTAPAGKLLVSVRCLLDGLGLQDPTITMAVSEHSHNHVQAGGAAPFRNHKLMVTATYNDGSQEQGEEDWQDPI
jgi:hypothetical protein